MYLNISLNPGRVFQHGRWRYALNIGIAEHLQMQRRRRTNRGANFECFFSDSLADRQ